MRGVLDCLILLEKRLMIYLQLSSGIQTFVRSKLPIVSRFEDLEEFFRIVAIEAVEKEKAGFPTLGLC